MTKTKPEALHAPHAIGEHMTPNEIAALWKLSPRTVRRIFQDDPRVLKLGRSFRPNKRGHQTLRIPVEVVEEKHQELTGSGHK